MDRKIDTHIFSRFYPHGRGSDLYDEKTNTLFMSEEFTYLWVRKPKIGDVIKYERRTSDWEYMKVWINEELVWEFSDNYLKDKKDKEQQFINEAITRLTT